MLNFEFKLLLFFRRIPTLSTNETSVFEFQMTALKELLKKQAEQNPKASYFNIDILKYQVRLEKNQQFQYNSLKND